MAKKVFFSFHYQDVIDFRANVVRNHWVSKPDRAAAGYFDKSIWEEAKKNGDIALKRMINSALENTSNTVVLAGSKTYERPWVRYEILKSFLRGNHILSVNINNYKDKNRIVKPKGPNPLDYVAASLSSDGKSVTLMEYQNGSWVNYNEIDSKSTHPRPSGLPSGRQGTSVKLSQLFPEYDWIKNDGYNNFSAWLK
ncbi:TIR domain-containing protein [Pectobacterium fontis]|uniref:Thoeris protein ThsB TIR-like domain-containing protein n=1 Tax=Pectobacterium fontis TaxID=2558042 RepID=A0A7V8L6M1_9GAMM|nr:TIR domain-containing protein [Pectobacterium fontis]KHN56271.1 hypothetical protein OI69_01530 [Pectobacterium fontis]